MYCHKDRDPAQIHDEYFKTVAKKLRSLCQFLALSPLSVLGLSDNAPSILLQSPGFPAGTFLKLGNSCKLLRENRAGAAEDALFPQRTT